MVNRIPLTVIAPGLCTHWIDISSPLSRTSRNNRHCKSQHSVMEGLIFEVKIGPDWSFFVADVRFGRNGAESAGLRANHIPGLGVSESQNSQSWSRQRGWYTVAWRWSTGDWWMCPASIIRYRKKINICVASQILQNVINPEHRSSLRRRRS